MNATLLFRTMGRSWWFGALIFSVVVASTAYFTYTQKPVYRTNATLVIWPHDKDAGLGDTIRSLNLLERRSLVATYAQICSSLAVRDQARRKTKLTLTQMRRYASRTSVLPDTNILRISVRGPDPGLAAELANAIAETANDYIKESFGIYQLRVLDSATSPDHPVKPNVSRNIGIGVVLGVVLGIGFAFLFELLRSSGHIPKIRADAQTGEALSALRSEVP